MRHSAMRLLAALPLLSMAAATPGCSTGSNTCSTIPITASDSYIIIKKDAIGSSWTVGLLGFPLLNTPDLYSALQDAKEANGADGLINVTASSEVRMYVPPFTVNEVNIRGDAIKLRRGGRK